MRHSYFERAHLTALFLFQFAIESVKVDALSMDQENVTVRAGTDEV